MGTVAGLTLSGFIVDSLGWEAMFYIEGPIALIFLVMWMTLVYDSPEQHPRISDKEKAYIAAAIGQSASKKVSAASSSSIGAAGSILHSIEFRLKMCQNSNRKCPSRGDRLLLPFPSGPC